GDVAVGFVVVVARVVGERGIGVVDARGLQAVEVVVGEALADAAVDAGVVAFAQVAGDVPEVGEVLDAGGIARGAGGDVADGARGDVDATRGDKAVAEGNARHSAGAVDLGHLP